MEWLITTVGEADSVAPAVCFGRHRPRARAGKMPDPKATGGPSARMDLLVGLPKAQAPGASAQCFYAALGQALGEHRLKPFY
jgi:hypothetical protein